MAGIKEDLSLVELCKCARMCVCVYVRPCVRVSGRLGPDGWYTRRSVTCASARLQDRTNLFPAAAHLFPPIRWFLSL